MRFFITKPGYPGPMRLVFAVLAALVLAPTALAGGPAMRVGATEDQLKQPTLVGTKAQLDLLKLAGLDTARVTSVWAPGDSIPSADDLAKLDNVVGAARLAGVAVYVGVTNFGSRTT